MIQLKRARYLANPAVCGSFLADDYIKTRRDILVLAIHNFPAVIASVSEPTTVFIGGKLTILPSFRQSPATR